MESIEMVKRRAWAALSMLVALGATACDDDSGGSTSPDATSPADMALIDAAVDLVPDVSADSEVETIDSAVDGAVDVGVDMEINYPDPSFIHEVRAQTDPSTPDQIYFAETTTHFRLPETLPGVEASSVVVIGETVYAGTVVGLARLDPDEDVFRPIPLGEQIPIVDIADQPLNDGSLVAITTDRVLTLGADGDIQWIAAGEAALTAVATNGERILVGQSDGVGHVDAQGNLERWPGTEGWSVRGVAANATSVYVATDQGLRVLTDDRVTTIGEGSDFRDVTLCADDRILAGNATGLVWVAGEAETDRIDPAPRSLPTDRVTAVACQRDWLLAGHEIGASALRPDLSHIDHYFTRRWVLNNEIRDVALAADGARWFATVDGISRVDYRMRTISEKATVWQTLLDRAFWRADGFVSSGGGVADPWDMTEISLGDSDNDGLWTQMMIGGWAFAHAVTGDDFYCDEARRAMGNMLMLIDLPCITFAEAGLECGFISRSFTVDDEGSVFEGKAEQSNWHLVDYEGRQYYWKDDTSSDETTGHFFGWPLYYDICANDEEKATIASYAARLMDYIIAGDFLLLDLDGEKTMHGHWSPDHISSCVDGMLACRRDHGLGIDLCASACYGGGYLNGAEILGHLLATYHMTGERRFYAAYERLIQVHRYDEVVRFTEDIVTLTRPALENHSDHELMMLAFHTLIRYEPNPERRQLWIDAFRGMYDTETDERNPLWAAFAAGTMGYEFDREAAIVSMHQLSDDPRSWGFDCSHRLDYVRRPGVDRHGDPQFTEAPPYDELRPWWWNTNPFSIEDGDNGRHIVGPMAYLLAYWSMRHYGLLGPAAE